MSDLSRVTAVILAGGMGTRLRKVVSDRPKVMAQINGKPFIAYLLDQLVAAGIGRVIISTGYMADILEDTFGTRYNDLHVDYCREETPLGTAGALKLAGQAVDTEQCLVMNGDSYTKFDPLLLLMNHKKTDANITIVIKKVEDSSRYGTIQMNEQNKIIKFMEKGIGKGFAFINAGVYIMNSSTIQKIQKNTPCSLEYDFFPAMIGKNIYGYEAEGRFIDIGTPESYAKAEKFFNCKPVSA
jgi:NDP-sugar pyrophosphorylase family protein